MPTLDPRVDAYIARAADFAKPVLTHLRALVHKACPQVEEKIKWGMPCFDFKGPMCNMASFKQHCAFGFWKASLMKDKALLDTAKSEEAMGHLGRITSLKSLPADRTIIGYIKEAAKLNEEGVKVKRKPVVKTAVVVPAFIVKALKANKKAEKTFQEFSNSHRKEYVQWITEAKTEATREKRIETMLEWLEEGKIRNWKYAR